MIAQRRLHVNIVHQRGFTLIEMLVVVGLLAVLVGIALPSFSHVRRASQTAGCLANMRSIQQAHWSYMQDNRGNLIEVGLPHGAPVDEEIAWINTLAEYYSDPDVIRSPLDTSPHWPTSQGGRGVPVSGSAASFRRTSYGCNNYLTQFSPATAIDPDAGVKRLTDVKNPATTVHFLVMAYEGEFAGADHVHVENWWVDPPVVAASQMQTNHVRGRPQSPDAMSNYGFLDGSVRTEMFSRVYVDRDVNLFDPAVSFRVSARTAQ